MDFLLYIALAILRPFEWPDHHQKRECLVFSDRASLLQAWTADGGASEKLPEVDWKKEMVVAAFAGQKPTAGHRLRIHTVAVEAGENKFWDLEVIYEEKEPEGMAAQVISYPSHVTGVARRPMTGTVHYLPKGSREAQSILGNLKP